MAYRKPLSKILSGVTRFGRLTVIGDAASKVAASGFEARYALVRCDCGVEKAVRAADLRNGYSNSCGCEQRRLLSKAVKTRATIHGESSDPSPEYGTWLAMRKRCLQPENIGYADYGGRGITIAERWSGAYGFANFLDDLGRKPTGAHTLDRIDNDGHYEPRNCRWATPKDQARNRRSSTAITVGGETMTVVEWAEAKGVSPDMIYNRLRLGWSHADAVNRPSRYAD